MFVEFSRDDSLCNAGLCLNNCSAPEHTATLKEGKNRSNNFFKNCTRVVTMTKPTSLCELCTVLLTTPMIGRNPRAASVASATTVSPVCLCGHRRVSVGRASTAWKDLEDTGNMLEVRPAAVLGLPVAGQVDAGLGGA